jgi:hypothetical protein
MAERRFSSHQRVMKSLHMGTGRYLCKMYNYHDSRACGYKWSDMLPRIEGMVWEWDGWIWFGTTLWYCVILCDPLWIKLCDHFVPLYAFVIIPCDIFKFNLMGSFSLQL